MPAIDAPRTRRSFARLDKVLDVPNLIDIQRRSFEELTDSKRGGLRETIDDISPIEDYTGNLAVQFGEFTFDAPVASLDECREKDLTYARPLTVTVAFVNRAVRAGYGGAFRNAGFRNGGGYGGAFRNGGFRNW